MRDSYLEAVSKPVIFAVVVLALALMVWSQGVFENSVIVIGVVALITAAFLADPDFFDYSNQGASSERGWEKEERYEREERDWSFRDSGDHSRASDEQILEIPEEHEEEAHHTPAGH